MKNVDKYRQKEIGQYISCLATIGEQVDICTDVAYRLTLWYSDQIQCLAEPSKFWHLRRHVLPPFDCCLFVLLNNCLSFSSGDSSKTSICLHAPARRMAQLAVGIIYSSLMEKRIEKGILYIYTVVLY